MDVLSGRLLRRCLLALLALACTAGAEERTTYYVADHAGSPVAAVDAQGALLWRESYAPFGERRIKAEANDGRSAYTGKAEDIATGLVYMGGRWQDPLTGRFTGIDPQGFSEETPQSFNRYAYANNNPYRYVDPDGNSPVDVVFLAYDVGKLGVAVYTGVGVGAAAADAAISAGSVFSPIPFVGEAAKIARAGERVAGAGKAAKGAKRGPKTDPSAPHNAKIREIADQIEADGGTVIAGGGKLPERLIPTPGGKKGGRRPDIIYRDCSGALCGVNVGRTTSDGSPIKRERQALEDLSGAGFPTRFERYD